MSASSDQRVTFVDENDCRIESFELAAPGPGEVRIRNIASLVSAGTELAVLRKRHRAFASGGEAAAQFRYPFHPGYAAVGVIESIGRNVTGFSTGDMVWHPGPHATGAVMPADRCLAVPTGIEARDAVFFGLAQIAMTAIRRAPVALGDSVLVSGLGLVGILVGSLYQLAGARVAAADFSPGRRSRAAMFGFDPVIDLKSTSLVDWYSERPDSRPDVAIEAAGIEANIEACMKAARQGGRVVLQGSPRKPMEIDPYTDIHRKGLTLIGAHDGTVSAEVRQKDVPYLFSLCAGPLRIENIRTHEFAFDQAPTVYDRVETDLDEYLGVVLTY